MRSLPRLAPAMFVLILTAVVSFGGPAEGEAIVARIDQYEIPVAELRLFIGWHRALLAKQLFPGAEVVTPAMWRERRGTTTPADLLRDAALEDALHTKARQIVFRERGLTTAVAFKDIQAETAVENNRRAAALAAGNVIYGPKSWTTESYYRQRDAELAIRLREQLRGASTAGQDRTDLTDELERRASALGRDRLGRAKVVIDRAVLAAVPIE